MIGGRALSRDQAGIVSADVEWEAPVQVILDEDESQSYVSLIVSQVLDQVELSDEAAEALREWRGSLESGSEPLQAFTDALNDSLGNTIDEELSRQVRRRDYYRRT